MPTGDRPGWRRVFSDDFVGTALDEDRWGAYWGQPAGDPGGWWEPSHVEVGGGAAILRTYRDPAVGGRWVSGGMSSAPALKQRYGKYEVRFRMDAGYGIFPVLLLFASADRWPPEIDFAEDGGNTRVRDHMNATLHYGVRPNNRQIQRRVFADFTRWHTMGVEWTAGRIAYTLDGEVWATLTGPNVPAERMELDIQTQAGTQGDRWNPAPDDSHSTRGRHAGRLGRRLRARRLDAVRGRHPHRSAARGRGRPLGDPEVPPRPALVHEHRPAGHPPARAMGDAQGLPAAG